MFMVRADSPYRSISDLKGKPVVWGAASSGFIVLARYVMDGLGLDIKKDFEAILLDKAGDGPPMVLDGRAAAMWGGGVGWPAIHDDRERSAGRAFHCAERRRNQTHHGQSTRSSSTDHVPAGQLSGARRSRAYLSPRPGKPPTPGGFAFKNNGRGDFPSSPQTPAVLPNGGTPVNC